MICMRSGAGIFFALLAWSSMAQDDLSFPDSAAAWTNAYYYYPPPPPGPELTNLTSYCANGQDTVLFDVEYKRIDTCGGGYKGAIRVLNEQVYFVPKDSLQEFLLYDFSLVFGDTAYDVYMEEPGGGAYVRDVRIFYDNSWLGTPGRRAFDTSEGVWIQGVGSHTGLFMNSGVNVSNYLIELYCMSREDSTIYGVAGCPVSLGVGSDLEASVPTLHPNPTSGSCRLQLGGAPMTLFVRTLTGSVVEVPMYISGSEVILDLAGLAPGLYMVETIRNGARNVHRVLRQ